jgi:hypothetical protein
MSRLVLNETSMPLGPALRTWQDLLSHLESQRLSRDEVITSVQFDGDDISNFRDDNALATNLEAIEEVRVRAMARDELMRETIVEAEAYLRNLEAAAVNVAEMFRCQQLNQANNGLQDLLSGIKLYVALLRGMDLSVSGLAGTCEPIDKVLEPMAATLQEQINAQGRQDWMLVADILEYELAAQLTAFDEVLNGFKTASGVAAR